MASRGRSSSMTPASIGAQLEERRVTRIRDVLDFPEELESRENCGERHRSSAIPCSRAKQKSKKTLTWSNGLREPQEAVGRAAPRLAAG